MSVNHAAGPVRLVVLLWGASLLLAGCTERNSIHKDAAPAADVSPRLDVPSADLLPPVDLITPADLVAPPDLAPPPDTVAHPDARICGPGTSLCGKLCVNLQGDVNNCGACSSVCKTGEVCTAGKCVLSCQPGLTNCAGFCVNLQSDISNCGACASTCKSGQVCTAGKCALSCQAGLTDCAGICVNLQSDLSNCGACATTCKSGQVCTAGKCALTCQAGLTECSGLCVDLQTSGANCGACASSCKTGEVCKASKCVVACQSGLTDCNGACLNLKTDVFNCGGCGAKCGLAKWCCGGSCRDVLADPLNCGGCGAACKAGEACTAGKCGCTGSAKATPGLTCQAIAKAGCSKGDGNYWVDPDGGSTSNAFQVYCDMTSKGGPWTLVLLNSVHKIPPKPTWSQAINDNNISGNINGGLTAFDQLVGLKQWELLGNTLKLEMGAGPSAITRRATYLFSLDSAKYYAVKLSAQELQLGTVAAGLYGYLNGAAFTTYDADHDTYSGNCSHAFSNTAWWYASCWSGSFWGGGDQAIKYTNNPYWEGSTTDYHAWGAIWISSRKVYKSCKEALAGGVTTSGAMPIDPTGGDPGDAMMVYCDMTTDGGGWTQIEYLTTDGEGAKAGYAAVYSSANLGTPRKGSYKVPAHKVLALSTELRYSEPSTPITDSYVDTWTHDIKCGITADVRHRLTTPGFMNQVPAKVTCTNLPTGLVSTRAVLLNYQGWSGCWTGPQLWVGMTAKAPTYHGDYCVDCVATWKCGTTIKGVYSTVSSASGSQGSGAFWLR